MVHKIFPSPTTGVEVNFLYGSDWNKLIDHLEGRSKTDPFTFTVDQDIIKHSTTNVAGDILVNTGTRFGRLAVGLAGQVPAVKTDLTGLEWIDPPVGGGGAPGGGGINAGGTILKSGNASTTVFLIPHGLSPIPEVWFVDAMTSDAMGNCTKTIDATNITVTYAIPPPTGTNNLQFVWGAGYVNAASGDFTPTSTHTLTGKTVNIDANTLKHSTTNTTGDLYKYDGTKISRFARGTALQVPRVNTGATDLEWYTPQSATETLTGKTMHNDSNTFPFVGAYNAIIYKSGSTYKAKKGDGTLIASSTTLDGVVQAALDLKGLILWPAASDDSAYLPSSGLTGWELSSNTTLLMGYNTRITVPEIFSGTVFKINDAYGGAHVAYHIKIQGGSIQQAGVAPDAQWTAFDIQSSSSTSGNGGVCHLSLRDIYVKRCLNFIKLTCTSGTNSFVNGNSFEGLWCDYPHEGIVFNQAGAVGTSIQAINRNHFSNIVIQADQGEITGAYAMLTGYKDISGVNNVFTNCKCWDVEAPNKSSNITNKAENTIIQGGLMVQQPYDWEVSCDFGLRSRVDGTEKSGGTSVGASSSLSTPFIRKMGLCHATGSTSSNLLGDGLMAGFNVTSTGTFTTPTPTASGHFKRADCTSTATTIAGFRSGSVISSRNFNPVFAIRFKLNQTTNQRIFVGFASSTAVTLGTSDDPLANLSGFGLYHSTTHGTSATNWLSCTNTGSATSTFANTTLAANNTNVHTVYIAGWEDGPKFQWRLDNVAAQIGNVTSTIPGQFTAMTPGIWISNGAASQANTLDFFGAYLKHAVAEV